MDIQELKDIYSSYEEKLNKAVNAASVFAGAFNMGDDPRNHACNDLFYEAAGDWAARLAASDCTPETAAEAVRWILEAAANGRDKPTYWYLYAAQKHALLLIPKLEKQEAAAIRETFLETYSKNDWLPVQREVCKSLTRQMEKPEASGENNNKLRHFLAKVLKK